jgi:hypothetical protein
MEAVRVDTRPLARDQVTIACPDCGGPATIEWSTPVPDEPAPEHIRITCVEPHDLPRGRPVGFAGVGQPGEA